ncbi:MAG TPA: hypothetical protein VE487_14480 [Ilumatobacter sp.]|nr:hypothetical protein [Ilumatobacter sp.]
MGATYEPLRMFGAPSTNSQLAWSWVEQQLSEAETYWVDVVGAGPRPHARPVWGVWLDDQLHLSIGTPAIRRAATPGTGAAVHLPDGLDVVIVEGEIAGPTRRAEVVGAYDEKYDWTYDLEQYGPFTTIAPGNVLAWRAAGPAGRDGFAHTGRWTWSH